MSRLDDIKARVAAAAEGPWKVTVYAGRDIMDTRIETQSPADPWPIVFAVGDCAMITNSDAEFIAHARADVPWLVQRVERLERALETVEWTDSQELKRCPWCQRTEPEGHAATCLRQAALAEDA